MNKQIKRYTRLLWGNFFKKPTTQSSPWRGLTTYFITRCLTVQLLIKIHLGTVMVCEPRSVSGHFPLLLLPVHSNSKTKLPAPPWKKPVYTSSTATLRPPNHLVLITKWGLNIHKSHRNRAKKIFTSAKELPVSQVAQW